MTLALQKILGIKRGNYMSYLNQGIDAETCDATSRSSPSPDATATPTSRPPSSRIFGAINECRSRNRYRGCGLPAVTTRLAGPEPMQARWLPWPSSPHSWKR